MAITHTWVSILCALLALMLSTGWVLASSLLSYSWDVMCVHWLVLFGDVTTLSLLAGLILVSSLVACASLLLCCFCIPCVVFMFATLVCVVKLFMSWIEFSASLLLKFVATA